MEVPSDNVLGLQLVAWGGLGSPDTVPRACCHTHVLGTGGHLWQQQEGPCPQVALGVYLGGTELSAGAEVLYGHVYLR